MLQFFRDPPRTPASSDAKAVISPADGRIVVVAQATVPATTNEIPVLPTLLRPLPLAGTIVTADALHTQVETARFLVEEKHAD